MFVPLCYFNPIALRKAKIVYNFGLSECNRVKKKDFVVSEQILSFKSSFEMGVVSHGVICINLEAGCSGTLLI